MCFCDEASGSSALLAVRKTPISVRHYEAGALGREAISRQMVFMLENLGCVPSEVPPRTNCSLVAIEELIAHYSEADVREVLGETKGCLGWAQTRVKKVMGHLKGLHNTLETARKKWCIEANQIEAKHQQLTEAMVAKVLSSEERRKAFEARWNEVKARNKRMLEEGSFEGPIVPIGLGHPEPKKKRFVG